MKCTTCGCPGAYSLLRSVICWNRDCRNFHTDVVSGSDFSTDGKRVNGDSTTELKEFIHLDSVADVPDKFLKWKN